MSTACVNSVLAVQNDNAELVDQGECDNRDSNDTTLESICHDHGYTPSDPSIWKDKVFIVCAQKQTANMLCLDIKILKSNCNFLMHNAICLYPSIRYP